MIRSCRALISQCGLHLRRCSLAKAASNLKKDDVEEMETPANRQRVELPPNPEEKLSKRYLAFREKLRSEAPLEPLPECAPHPAHEKEPLKPWPNNTIRIPGKSVDKRDQNPRAMATGSARDESRISERSHIFTSTPFCLDNCDLLTVLTTEALTICYAADGRGKLCATVATESRSR
uniref:IP09707p n=1 Tax=Drosophila melanogaster TaxID=7227 RepID=Q4QQ56_DROME|nr:IP09707p [Drosophila melanogaster]